MLPEISRDNCRFFVTRAQGLAFSLMKQLKGIDTILNKNALDAENVEGGTRLFKLNRDLIQESLSCFDSQYENDKSTRAEVRLFIVVLKNTVTCCTTEVLTRKEEKLIVVFCTGQ